MATTVRRISMTGKHKNYRFSEMIKLGMPIEDLKKDTKLGKQAFRAKIRQYMYHVVNDSQGVCFGSKTVPYYSSEDMYGFVPEYSYNELSLNEREFYESKN